MVIEEFGGADKLHLKEVQKPIPLEEEVLIRVAYAGVNPVDRKLREGTYKDSMPYSFPIILGWDVSGTVAACGKKVQGLRVGDEVFACVRKRIVQWGSYAEYIAFQAKDVVKKPKNITLAQAAALPLVCLTSWQSLFDAAQLKKGETVLIHGGSGGVGSIAIQMAKFAGAHVITTASGKKMDYVRARGADQIIDYKCEDFAQIVKEIDVVFDTMGGETYLKSLSCLKKGGRIASLIQRDSSEAERLGLKGFFVYVEPEGSELKQIADLIELGSLIPPEVQEFSLEEAPLAQEKERLGALLGKAVLKI